MDKILLLLILLAFFKTAAQETKTVNKRTAQTIDEYEVLKSDKSIKNGKYTKKMVYGLLLTKGQFKNNEKVGTWEFYDLYTGQLEQKYNFDINKFEFIDLANSREYNFYNNNTWTISKLDTMPLLIGGLSELRVKLAEIAYSKSKAPKFPKEGMALFSFIVTKEGATKDFKVSYSSDNTFENEILNAIKEFKGTWLPGKYKGELVDTEVLIPMYVKYKVNTDYEKQYSIDFNYPVR